MYIKVKEGETAAEIAVRAGCPLCMLLRANGVISASWLELMDEVRLPAHDECAKSAFVCPNAFSKARIHEKVGYIVKKGDTAEEIARMHHLPARIVHACLKDFGCAEGKPIVLPLRTEEMIGHTVKIGETWKDYENACELKLLNMHFQSLLPGMKILIKRT